MLQEPWSSEVALECRFTCVNIMFLVQFLELHHLEEDMLKDMFGILLVLWQFISDSKNVTTLPDVEFQVVFSTLIGNLSKPGLLGGERLV